MNKRLLIVISGLLSLSQAAFADINEPENPCSSAASLFSLVDRPSKADSSCTIPYGDMMYEMGYQYLDLIGGGNLQNFPQITLRAGLPENTEIFALLPSYNVQSIAPTTGFGATTLGLKHVFHYSQQWIWTAEALLTPTSGSAAFGDDGASYTINGIAAYTINNSLSATFMLGFSSQTLPELSDGQRFTSLNPDALLSWQINNKWLLFGETYAQTKTGPDQGGGLDVDGGVQFLAAKRVILDAEAGQRISGEIGGYNNYFGFGLAILLG
ncbi:MAG: transporter [Gammaproteobacteria bacterium]|nr:transporter [Gammaproteobacteria bacterium]